MHRLRTLGILTALAVFIAACSGPTPPAETFDLVVSIEGSGEVRFDTATGDDAAGTSSHAAGSEVTLVAVPATGWELDEWTGACSGADATCDVTMDADKSVTAKFTEVVALPPETVTVNVVIEGTGTGAVSSPIGIDCGDGTGDVCTVEELETGSEVTLTATATGDSVFAGWGGDAASCGTDDPCVVTLSKTPFTVLATFNAPDDPGVPAHSVAVNANNRDAVEWVTAPVGAGPDDVLGATHTGLQYSGLAYIPRYQAEVANAFVFRDLGIPAGATVTRAYIQFTTIDRGTDPDYRPSEGDPSLKITGVAAASHATIPQQEPGNNITSRPRTTAQVIWEDIPVWVGHGVTGEAQRTADISAILQELVDLPAWSETGDAMIIIENNSGDPASNFRQIATHNDAPEKAPVLYFDWELP